jgi:hypothetical protein
MATDRRSPPPRRAQDTPTCALLVGVFFATGTAALLYPMIWQRMLA